MRVLITGGNGFIGSAIIEAMLIKGIHSPVAAIRLQKSGFESVCEVIQVGDIGNQVDWKKDLESIDVIVHTAARVHVMHEKTKDPLSEFRRVNVEGTLNLAKQAADSGVNRFIFLSSAKVNGESTSIGRPFKPEDKPHPVDPYGISKLEAENSLFELAAQSGMEIVCVRPTLVYGPGAKGNFASLLKAVKRGIPLPLGRATENKRSLVALSNLVNLLIKCVEHPKAANQIFLVSDGEDVSTADLIFRMGRILGNPARLINIPLPVLKLAATVFRKTEVTNRLLTNLQVDIEKNQKLLDWTPPTKLNEGLNSAIAGRLKIEKGLF